MFKPESKQITPRSVHKAERFVIVSFIPAYPAPGGSSLLEMLYSQFPSCSMISPTPNAPQAQRAGIGGRTHWNPPPPWSAMVSGTTLGPNPSESAPAPHHRHSEVLEAASLNIEELKAISPWLGADFSQQAVTRLQGEEEEEGWQGTAPAHGHGGAPAMPAEKSLSLGDTEAARTCQKRCAISTLLILYPWRS